MKWHPIPLLVFEGEILLIIIRVIIIVVIETLAGFSGIA